MSRMDDLLVSTVRELKEGRAPLNGDWLARNDVAFDEALALADTLATAIHTYRAAMKLAMQLSGSDDDQRTLPQLVASMSIRQGGPFVVLAEAARLEEECDGLTVEPSGLTNPPADGGGTNHILFECDGCGSHA